MQIEQSVQQAQNGMDVGYRLGVMYAGPSTVRRHVWRWRLQLAKLIGPSMPLPFAHSELYQLALPQRCRIRWKPLAWRVSGAGPVKIKAAQ